MSDIADVAGLMSHSPTATVPSVAGKSERSAERIRLRMGDLSPAKCINPMRARAAGSGGPGCGQEVACKVLIWAGMWVHVGRVVGWPVVRCIGVRPSVSFGGGCGQCGGLECR
eukprot:13178846-Alexandrium_andersonii.AAC.1